MLSHLRQELVLIFSHIDEKTNFMNLMKFYSKELKKLPMQIDALLLSFFTLIDQNRNSTLSDNEIEKMLVHLKLSKKEDYLKRVIDFVRNEEDNLGELTFRQF